MPKKEKTMHCPNCGAPIRSVPVSGSVVKCDYCDSLVNVPDFFPSKPAPPPAPKPAPVAPAPKPPVPPPVDFAPKAPVPQKKRKLSDQDIIAIIEVVLAVIIVFTWPIWLRGCLMGF